MLLFSSKHRMLCMLKWCSGSSILFPSSLSVPESDFVRTCLSWSEFHIDVQDFKTKTIVNCSCKPSVIFPIYILSYLIMKTILVAFKLSKRKADDNLQLLHTILFGKKAKVIKYSGLAISSC